MQNNLKYNENIEHRLNNVFKKLGLLPHLKGYEYLIKIIKLIYENYENLYTVKISYVYKDFAELCNTTDTKVERAIRHAILSISSDTEMFKFLFGEYKSLTNSQFVYTLVNELRLNNI